MPTMNLAASVAFTVHCAAIVWSLCSLQFADAQPPQNASVKTDSIGDPLPESALLRFGTLRFRPGTGVDHIALSPDEASLVTVGNHVTAWDTKTGKERWRSDVKRFGLQMRGSRYGAREVVFSSDSSRFFTTYGLDRIAIWDVESGNRDELAFDLPAGFPNELPDATLSLDVTADGEMFALGRADGILVFDLEGEILFDIGNAPNGPVTDDRQDRLAFFGHYSTGRFSPDGSKFTAVTSDRPEEIRVYDALSGRELMTLELKARLVRLDFSPDGKRLVATERDHAVRMYDVETGERLWSRVIELDNIYENYTSGVACSPDGKTVAAGATDHAIYLLDSSTGEEIGRLKGHHGYPWTLAFTRDSRMLYSAGWDGTIRRWDVVNRRQLPPPEGVHGSEVIAASPDGETLAVQDDAGTIHLTNLHAKTEIELPGQSVSQLKFSPDGRHLAGGGGRDDQVFVTVWNVATGERFRHWSWPKGRDPHSHVEALSFAPDGGKLAAAVFRQSSAYVWDVAGDKQLAHLKHGQIYGLSFSPDGQTLATAGWDSIVRFWDTSDWTARRELKVVVNNPRNANPDFRMYAVCYAPEGGLLATTHMDGYVRVWQADEMSLVSESRVNGSFGYNSLAFSPDGLWLATGASGGSVELFDPVTGQLVWNRRGHQHYVYTLSFGRDSRTLVTGSDDGLGYLWDLRPLGQQPKDREIDPLWDELAGEDSAAAYQAMWALTDVPDRAVPLLAKKLRPVTSLVTPEPGDAEQSEDELDELERQQRLQVDQDPKLEFERTARRAISVLSQINSSDAIDLLRELARKDPDGALSRFAQAALNRQKVIQSTPYNR